MNQQIRTYLLGLLVLIVLGFGLSYCMKQGSNVGLYTAPQPGQPATEPY